MNDHRARPRLRRLLAAPLALACLAALMPLPTFAQDAPAAASQGGTDESQRLDTITVTGTRISNPNVVSPTPISVITGDEIKATGAVNIGDVLTRMPQLATTFTMGNSGQGALGTAALGLQDLRNLGPNRTLVLVNGRRFVSSDTGTAGVDTNLIPADWIERVEIITGGASAVYGADAVSGVINFILKKNYQGADLHVQYGTTEHGGMGTWLASATAGSNFAGDRGNFAISVEHSHQDELLFPDRFGQQSYRALRTPGAATSRTLLPDAGLFITNTGGVFYAGDGNPITDVGNRYVFNPDGSVRPQRFDGRYDNGGVCQHCDYIDLNKIVQLQPKFDRTTLSVNSSFDLTPSHRIYFEGTYSVIDVKSLFQPAFGDYTITADNAYILPSLAQLMSTKGLDSIDLSRFDVDSGLRGEDTSRDTGRVVFGANGLLSEDWSYDASIVYGVTRESRANTNNRIPERFFASIDAVRDPATGQIVCRSTIDPGSINPNTGAPISDFGREGCIPTSLFGDGAINAAARRWFNATTFTTTRLTQTVASGTVTNNNLFQVPGGAGAASFVAGLEYRKEKVDQVQDPLDREGLTFLNAIPNFGGSYDVKEAFVEFAMPILADKPFIKNLNVDAAYRASDYDTVGHTKTWRWGLDWAFDDNVRMRGTMSAAVRAPNLSELFSGQAQNFFSVNDPCSASRLADAPDPALRARNCAALGIPPGFESSQAAAVPGLSGSNPNLKPETGRTYTFGFVFTPQFVEGMGFNIDYWNMKLTNAISSVSGQDTVDRCVDSPSGISNQYCPNATRDPNTHELNFIRTLNVNLSALSTSGIDIGAYYTHDLGPGRLRLDVNATRVILFTEFPFQEDPTSAVQDNGTQSFPKWKATLSAAYKLDRWVFNWNMRYFSSMLRVSNESFAANPLQTTPITSGSRTYNDVRVSYGVEKQGWQVYGGINNVFDRNPPVNIFGTVNGLYEPLGRAYYAGFNYNF